MKKILPVTIFILALGIIAGFYVSSSSNRMKETVKSQKTVSSTPEADLSEPEIYSPPTLDVTHTPTPPVLTYKATVKPTKKPTVKPSMVIEVEANRACIGSKISDFEKKYGKYEHAPNYEFYSFYNDNFVAMVNNDKVHYVNILYDVITRTPDFEDALKKTKRFLPTDAKLYKTTKAEEGMHYYYKSKTLEQNNVLFNGFAIVVINANDDGIYSSYVAAGEKP